MAETDMILSNRAILIQQINPDGHTENCAECAVLTDRMLQGLEFRKASEGGLTSLRTLERLFGSEFDCNLTRLRIESSMSEAGPGARAIIHGYREDPEVGHFINAINDRGSICYYDGQLGSVADLSWFVDGEMALLRTD